MSANTTHRTIFYKFSPFHPLLTHLSPTATITLTTTLPLSQRKEHLMAKEQIAVAELITNIILGKTDGASRVDFFPQKLNFHLTNHTSSHFPAPRRRARVFPLTCWPTCCGIWTLHTIQTCTISWFSEMERSSARPILPPTAAGSGT